MLTTFIGVQTICVGISAFLTYKSTRKAKTIKLVSKEKGFKYYKAGGF